MVERAWYLLTVFVDPCDRDARRTRFVAVPCHTLDDLATMVAASRRQRLRELSA